uniref:Ovule protein n=1 Tax=Panagrolaimus sp. JU765 TaxID=591449 RepID=A0AC34QKN1_9BILA
MADYENSDCSREENSIVIAPTIVIELRSRSFLIFSRSCYQFAFQQLKIFFTLSKMYNLNSPIQVKKSLDQSYPI